MLTQRCDVIGRLIVSVVLVSCLPIPLFGSDSLIVVPGAVLERVFSGGEFTEGPAMGPDGCVVFQRSPHLLLIQSIRTATCGKFDPATQECIVFRSPEWALKRN